MHRCGLHPLDTIQSDLLLYSVVMYSSHRWTSDFPFWQTRPRMPRKHNSNVLKYTPTTINCKSKYLCVIGLMILAYSTFPFDTLSSARVTLVAGGTKRSRFGWLPWPCEPLLILVIMTPSGSTEKHPPLLMAIWNKLCILQVTNTASNKHSHCSQPTNLYLIRQNNGQWDE